MEEKISLQSIFTAAWNHFIIGNGKPAYEKGGCKYLTTDGNKCAVGLCLPDGHESQKTLLRFFRLVKKYPELFDETIICSTESLLNDFQTSLHDYLISDNKLSENGRRVFVDKDEMIKSYKKIAQEYNLQIPEEVSAEVPA